VACEQYSFSAQEKGAFELDPFLQIGVHGESRSRIPVEYAKRDSIKDAKQTHGSFHRCRLNHLLRANSRFDYFPQLASLSTDDMMLAFVHSRLHLPLAGKHPSTIRCNGGPCPGAPTIDLSDPIHLARIKTGFLQK
jgi:hypothetical protein